jgi:hypothetical protein
LIALNRSPDAPFRENWTSLRSISTTSYVVAFSVIGRVAQRTGFDGFISALTDMFGLPEFAMNNLSDHCDRANSHVPNGKKKSMCPTGPLRENAASSRQRLVRSKSRIVWPWEREKSRRHKKCLKFGFEFP